MCVIFVAHRAHPSYDLVVAANRDEFHDRPTAPAGWWSDAPDILAGRDLLAGGTWMGVTRTGRFAAITNFHDGTENIPHSESRGALVTRYLTGTETPEAFIRSVEDERFGGFSLLASDADTLALLSNRSGDRRALPPGVHGLGNLAFSEPIPKIAEGRERVNRLLHGGAGEPPLVSGLFEVLSQQPLFVLNPLHGTRCSTVLLVRNGRVLFEERSFDRTGAPAGKVHDDFALRPPNTPPR